MPTNIEFEELFSETSQLQKGASQDAIKVVGKKLGFSLPIVLKNLLLWKDGGLFAQDRFVIFSADEGIHEDETLVSANSGLPDGYPLLNVGRDCGTRFGFLLSDLKKRKKIAVHAYFQDEGTTQEIADSLEEWIAWAENIAASA